MDPWEIIKDLIEYAIYPALIGMAYFVRKNFDRLDRVEETSSVQNTRLAVVESKVDDIRNDIKDIKRNVEKLVERK